MVKTSSLVNISFSTIRACKFMYATGKIFIVVGRKPIELKFMFYGFIGLKVNFQICVFEYFGNEQSCFPTCVKVIHVCLGLSVLWFV
jgi:hypothetical protein